VRDERAVGKQTHNSVGRDHNTGKSQTGRCIPNCGNVESEGAPQYRDWAWQITDDT
jgi:hypothetical protein